MHVALGRLIMLASILTVQGSGSQESSQEKPAAIDVRRMGEELRIYLDGPGEVGAVMWFATEMVEARLATSSSSVSPRARENLLKALKPYTVIMVVEGQRVATRSGVDFKSESDIRKELSIVAPSGNEFAPIHLTEDDASLVKALEALKSYMATFAGEFGQHTEFYVFRSKPDSTLPLVTVRDQGVLTVRLEKKEFKWHLPLSSAVPPQSCPTCGEKVSGSFCFCPWDGTSLRQSEKK